MVTVNEFLENIEKVKGRPSGWPGCFNYDFVKGTVKISLTKKCDNTSLRQIDPWGLAFVKEAEKEIGCKVEKIMFSIEKYEEGYKYYVESLLRRLSFLNFNNQNIVFELKLNGKEKNLYEKDLLFNRPREEIIDDKKKERSDKDTPGRLEKDFQAFLYGKSHKNDLRTNERLAILGDDFYDMKSKKFGIAREMPTGVYDTKISEKTRILPTNFVDVVTLNKYGQLSVIEIKVNDSKLEVISQILDYALFFMCYLNKIQPLLKANNINVGKKKDIICYVVNNHFHKRFHPIKDYYSTKGKEYGFTLKEVLLGNANII